MIAWLLVNLLLEFQCGIRAGWKQSSQPPNFRNWPPLEGFRGYWASIMHNSPFLCALDDSRRPGYGFELMEASKAAEGRQISDSSLISVAFVLVTLLETTEDTTHRRLSPLL